MLEMEAVNKITFEPNRINLWAGAHVVEFEGVRTTIKVVHFVDVTVAHKKQIVSVPNIKVIE